jgi:AP-3 complex subunit sigma
LDRAFENVCELDLVFHFDEVRGSTLADPQVRLLSVTQVHHILAEVIQGGLVLETNVEEIDLSGLVSLAD